ncbi:NADH-quinone oxidoreductase subunit NuoG [Ferrovibrio sp.]|uniref:NADH-quinone oxidoreductase subunit NuoG n=1 Tax=Ferrovibrio sp. TaxID=1917215 RepID=UPI0025BE4EC3|nr:NADH-quinone oxidoreductase subunit NuoG [Ferrovibrio sp.]MBX3454770.1 NADH-quinone oxidoreductase subunit NuoG [Ferrovibrio sp.]
MPKLTVDGIEVTVEPGTTVLQACELAGKEIPRFCYHERLSIAGNCRMCLVEQEKAPKPIASCAMPAADGMVIKTDTPLVKKAREGVMEFLLINHPLDCPICDQGGECDLQDQSVGYGKGGSRYDENKRAVKDKYMGPLVATTMTRCIHCTRCVRFATEVAGVPELGAIGRGEDMQITTYLEKAFSSELSGNVIDLCPVGALTSKPYAFTARSWELRKTDSIDAMDALGSNIRVDARGPEVMRILPRLNEDVNEEWISDKTRFAYDGLKRRRLDRPYVRVNGKLQEASWNEAFAAIAKGLKGLKGEQIAAIAGDMACAESMLALKDLLAALGSANVECRQDGAKVDPAHRASYLFNSTIAGIDQADAILIVGSDPRHEAAVLNARIRKRFLRGNVKIAVIGEKLDLTYRYEHLGSGPAVLKAIADGQHAFAEALKGAQNPMIILGQGALARPDGDVVLGLAWQVADRCGLVKDGWNGFNVLHTAAARVAGLDLGFTSAGNVDGILTGAQSQAIKAVYLLGADEINTANLGAAFVIYQGSHGDAGAKRADVILPGAAYTEKDAVWVNTEGRVQLGRRAAAPPGEAREDWAIIRALSEVLGHKLPYDNQAALRRRMLEVAPHFSAVDRVTPAAWGVFGVNGMPNDTAFQSPIGDFYLTNPIARASATMAECSSIARGETLAMTGSDD